MFRKMLLSPALFLGVVFQYSVGRFSAAVLHQPVSDLVAARNPAILTLLTAAIYGALTFFVFRVKYPLLQLNSTQLRFLWIGAFLVGAIGTPIIFSLVN